MREVTTYRGTSLITCGDFENACLFVTEIRNFSKTVAYFFKKNNLFETRLLVS